MHYSVYGVATHLEGHPKPQDIHWLPKPQDIHWLPKPQDIHWLPKPQDIQTDYCAYTFKVQN